MLLAVIGGVVAGVAVTFITAVGSLSENLILQEISSFVMDMMLPFIIWLILTPNTNKGYDRACFTCAYRPGLRKLIKPFVWAYWGSCISALCMVVLKHLPIGKLYLVGRCLMLVLLAFLLIHAVIYAVYKFGYIRFTKGKKAVLVVGGGSMKRQGFLDKAVNYLKEGGMEVQLIEGVEPDPSVETVMKGAKVMQEFQPDWIVAMGGGSPIDAAKAMWTFYEYPDTKFEDLITPFGFPELRQKARFAAIPSTSGTATEVTAFSVITDYNTGIKYPLADFNITPDVAIVDPELVEGLPVKQVAYTGMDALTHAIEAYVSTLHCPYTDPLALQAIEMVLTYLPASYNKNMEAREQMHYAQCLAGMAFSNALLGIVHSMAHKTGAAFSTGHIPHGCANAIYLPYVIKYNAKDPVAAERYAEIARRMGLEGTCQKALINSLCEKIDEFNVRLNIPKTLKDFGIQEDEFKEKVAKIAELAVGDACTGSNPRAIDPANMEKLLICIYYGTEVDF